MGTYTYKANTVQQVAVGTANGDLAPGTYDINAYGAQGGNWTGNSVKIGAYGNKEGGDVTLTSGEELEIVVGGQGGSGGYGVTYGGAGGGGGSFVLANTGSGFKPLLIAGGGGGAAQHGVGLVNGNTGSGESGGSGGAGYVQNHDGGGGAGGGGGGTGLSSNGSSGGNGTGAYGGGAGGSRYAGGVGGTGSFVGGHGGFGGGGGGGGGGPKSKGDGYTGGGGGGGGYNGGNGGDAGYTDPGTNTAGGYGGSSGTSFFQMGTVTPLQGTSGVQKGNGLVTIQAVCYAAGTLIRTAHGDVAVESLGVGDLAVTTSGAQRPIRWLGHRMIDCRRHPRPHEVLPIRIAANAFGENRPARDLHVSPGHAICFDVLGEVLVPAAALVNGTTVTQVEVDSVTYWHVELDSHDILLAENMPAESYLEMGNRDFFAESGVVVLGASPDAPVRTHADFCRPFIDSGPVLDAIRAQLLRRAHVKLGWTLEDEPLADLHLVVDGRRIEPHAFFSSRSRCPI